VQTAPGVAPIWFQLGLLYYVVEDVENATLALEQALALVPDYANAKYFLGLSYYAQGRVTEAIEHFQDLSVTNPDNQEVSLILSNMAAGRQPFEDATVPFTPPEERQNAPVEE
jgi:cytochrome c-type biogenesis protein CcmH/NrfG